MSQALSEASQSGAPGAGPSAARASRAAAISPEPSAPRSGAATRVTIDPMAATMVTPAPAGKAAGEVPYPVVVIAGPTASGKSVLALAAAEAFAGTVINADSLQVYRELTLLTARPDRATQA